jgi:hypothetical protein
MARAAGRIFDECLEIADDKAATFVWCGTATIDDLHEVCGHSSLSEAKLRIDAAKAAANYVARQALRRGGRRRQQRRQAV